MKTEKTLDQLLAEIEQRAKEAREVYDQAGENRSIALANYTMGEEYIQDIPKLLAVVKKLEDENSRLKSLIEELRIQYLHDAEIMFEMGKKAGIS